MYAGVTSAIDGAGTIAVGTSAVATIETDGGAVVETARSVDVVVGGTVVGGTVGAGTVVGGTVGGGQIGTPAAL